MARVYLGLLAGAVFALAPAAPSDAAVRSCKHFIIGRSNSSGFAHFRLPASGRARAASCETLERIARRIHRDQYAHSGAAAYAAWAPAWGPLFQVGDAGVTWSCRFQNQGGSGPTYQARCRHARQRLTWQTGY